MRINIDCGYISVRKDRSSAMYSFTGATNHITKGVTGGMRKNGVNSIKRINK